MLTLKKGAPLHLISFQYRTLIIVTSQESAEFCWHSTQFVWSALLQTRKNYFKTNLFWVKDMYRWRGRQQNTTLSVSLPTQNFETRNLLKVFWQKIRKNSSKWLRTKNCEAATKKRNFYCKIFQEGFLPNPAPCFMETLLLSQVWPTLFVKSGLENTWTLVWKLNLKLQFSPMRAPLNFDTLPKIEVLKLLSSMCWTI